MQVGPGWREMRRGSGDAYMAEGAEGSKLGDSITPLKEKLSSVQLDNKAIECRYSLRLDNTTSFQRNSKSSLPANGLCGDTENGVHHYQSHGR